MATSEFGTGGLVLRLLKDADGLVLAEGFDVGTQYLEVWPWGDVLSVVHDVVPDEEMGCYLCPAAHVVHECLVLWAAGCKRVGKAAFDAAQTDDYVVAWDNTGGRSSCILIGKGAHVFVGKFLSHRIGYLIHEPDHDAGMPAVLCLDSLALLALAE